MRVLHVINTLGGSGGAENGLVREITRFDASVDQMVVRLFSRNDLETRLTSQDIAVETLGLQGGADSRNWPVAAGRLRTWIRKYRPDVIHTSLFTANLAGQVAGRTTRVPVLSTFTQSGDVELVRSYQPGAASRGAAVLRAIATRVARSDRVRFRALTKDAAATNLRELRVPEYRARVIPRGVETSLPSPDPSVRRSFGVPPGAPLVVNIGRQAAQKGQEYLLDAFEFLCQQEPTAHLVILGREGDATNTIRARIAASPVGDRVHTLGFRSDARAILLDADVFMFSSLMEGLGTAVLEAMAAQIPVVAFDIPPVREITDGGRVAHLVPVGDGVAFGKTAAAVLEGSESDRAGLAYEWIRAQYDIDGVAASLQAYLETVAGLA